MRASAQDGDGNDASAHPLYGANIELTLACNMRCLHCGSQAGRARDDELTTAEFLHLFDDFAELDCTEVCLLGGEPFLHPEWETLAAAVGHRGMRLVMISNGFVVDRRLANRLKMLPNLDRIGISLDAATAEIHDRIRNRRGAFDRAVNALSVLRDAGFEVGAITTVSKLNLGELEKLRDLLLGQDISWQIQVASPHGGRFSRDWLISEREFYRVGSFISTCRNTYSIEDLPVAGSHDIGYFSAHLTRYAELPDWKGCPAGIYTVGVTSNGLVKGCLAQSDDFVEDDLRRRRFREIWEDDSLFAWNRRFTVDRLEGYCKSCPHGAVCRGGCSDQAYSLTGSPYNNPYCFYRLEQEGIVEIPETRPVEEVERPSPSRSQS
jgi:radical SAM protein with 4Fe4S-binding SPASM domain